MALSIEHFRGSFRGIERVGLPFRSEKPNNQSERLEQELRYFLEQGHLPKKPHKILSAEAGDPVFTLHLRNQRSSGIIEQHAYKVLNRYGRNAYDFSWDVDRDSIDSETIFRSSVHPNLLYLKSVFVVEHHFERENGERKGIDILIAKRTPYYDAVISHRIPSVADARLREPFTELGKLK